MLRSFIRHLAENEQGNFLLRAGVRAFDRTFCTPRAVRQQAAKKIRPARQRFSVAIAHYNRGSLIHLPLCNLLDHPAVEDVVIVDDGSEEKQFADLLRSVEETGAGDRVRVHRREQNKGALVTKAEAVSLAGCDWVLVLDSDNTVFRGYLDALAETDLSPDSFYCASWAFPFFHFSEFQGKRLDFAACSDAMRTGLLRRRYLMNDGNYLVPRSGYADAAHSLKRTAKDGADVMLVNYRWLTGGGALRVIPGTAYLHRLDPGSLYKKTQTESRARILLMSDRLERGVPCDDEFAEGLSETSLS